MKAKRAFLLFFASAVLILSAAASFKYNFKAPDFGKVELANKPVYHAIKVINVNTIVADINDKSIEIKLLGVRPFDHNSPAAISFVQNLLKGEDVCIVEEANSAQNNLGCYVYRIPDNLFINAEIIRQGFGLADTTVYFSYIAQFKQLEEFAKERGKGLWCETTRDSFVPASTAVPTTQNALEKSPESTAESEDVIVYVTKTGTRYHREDCMHLSKSKIPIKLSDAKSRGYAPCGRCAPPQ